MVTVVFSRFIEIGMLLPLPSLRLGGGARNRLTCSLGVPAPANWALAAGALASGVTPPVTLWPLPSAATLMVPDEEEEITVPKSRSATLVKVNGIRISALPVEFFVAWTGVAEAGAESVVARPTAISNLQ